jgi:microcystin-dependent protein
LVTLTPSEIPAHNHLINAGGAQTTNLPANALPAQDGSYATGTPVSQMQANAVGASGGGLPHTNIQPVLAVNFIIALQGVFPSRN